MIAVCVLGPAQCRRCGVAVVWALDEHDAGTTFACDAEPAPPGLGAWELYTEVFPDGTPVDGIQRVRPRPEEREARSPGWNRHRCAEAPRAGVER